MYFEESREKARFTASGSITLRGQTVPYNTVCEDNFIYGEDGQPIATVFTYSYFRSDVTDPSARPVMFCFNGGPGCGSVWVHVGLFGPRRLKIQGDCLDLPSAPPYELEDNPTCLLDLCDLVMIDPVGTGYGRLFAEKEKERFFSTHGDARCLSYVIDRWLSRYGRHNSPVLLAGESYGTTRAALLAGELLGAGPEGAETLGVSVSGVMLLGTAFLTPLPVETSVLSLGAYAAVNHFHNPQGKPGEEEFIAQAEEFAAGEYLSALYQGDAMGEARRRRVAGRLSRFTGLDRDYLLEKDLRVSPREFMHALLKKRGLSVGYYDGRFTWPTRPLVPDANAIADDPAMGQFTPAILSAMGLLAKELNITFDRSCLSLSHTVNKAWDRSFKTTPAQSLAGAMRRNRHLRVFFANGTYDICTTFGYARYIAAHSQLDPARVKLGRYPAGHMAYLSEESARLLGEDMRSFFSAALERRDG